MFQVCLRWNSYHSNMQNSFPSLLDTEQFVDVTLACEGRSLKCHKMILSSCSDYLADLLRENPCQHPIILMKDLKFWEVEALVKFMYRGEVNIAHDKLPQLLNAAEALQVKGLAGPSPSSQVSQTSDLLYNYISQCLWKILIYLFNLFNLFIFFYIDRTQNHRYLYLKQSHCRLNM